MKYEVIVRSYYFFFIFFYFFTITKIILSLYLRTLFGTSFDLLPFRKPIGCFEYAYFGDTTIVRMFPLLAGFIYVAIMTASRFNDIRTTFVRKRICLDHEFLFVQWIDQWTWLDYWIYVYLKGIASNSNICVSTRID